jgi:hypothetical protein
MKKSYIEIAWHPPTPMVERFDAEKFKVKTEDGCLKLVDSDGHPVRLFPWHCVNVAQFVTEEQAESPAPAPRPAGPRVVTGPGLVDKDGEPLGGRVFEAP